MLMTYDEDVEGRRLPVTVSVELEGKFAVALFVAAFDGTNGALNASYNRCACTMEYTRTIILIKMGNKKIPKRQQRSKTKVEYRPFVHQILDIMKFLQDWPP